MKSKIIALVKKAEKINFPVYDWEFDTFGNDLKAVIEANCGYSIAKTLQYDEDDGTYYVTVRASGVPHYTHHEPVPQDNFCVALERAVTIVPQGHLSAQIDAINDAKEHLETTRNLMIGMLDLQRAGYKMCDLSESS
jgi:hypothetical protein